jgi:hypothetical protein
MQEKHLEWLWWYDRVRIFFVFLAIVSMCIDFTVWHMYHSGGIMLSLMLVINFWGWLDAALRFPAMHDVESFFTLKQVILMWVKVFWHVGIFYNAGLSDFGWGAFLLVILFVANDIIAPAIYLNNLPLDDCLQFQEEVHSMAMVKNEDIIVRIWRPLKSMGIRGTFRKFQRFVVEAASESDTLRNTVDQLSPKYKTRRSSFLRDPKRCV